MTAHPLLKPALRPRILLVEDEVLIALMIADALEADGFDVIGPYQTVSQSLAQLDIPNCCDAAILDATLRNETALPVAQKLTSLAIPFVVATGYDRKQLSADFTVAPVLAKPVDTDALIGQLQRLLSAR